MCQFFDKRGYPVSVVQAGYHRAQQIDRQAALQTAEKENTDRIPFTLTFQRVPSYTHHKLELVSKGFLISKSKPFLSASVDNIQCSDGCPNKVLEHKCPWKQNNMHPKEVCLTPKIGDIVSENGFTLKPSSQYYFQLQLQMFVSELSLNILVV